MQKPKRNFLGKFSRSLPSLMVGVLLFAMGGVAHAVNYQLTVTTTGSGKVTTSPPGINCQPDCTESYPAGTPITGTATAAAGYRFARWTGTSCTTATCTRTLNSSATIGAVFERIPTTTYTLTVAVTGTGTVTSSPAGISCGTDCSEAYASGTAVTLTPAPATGYTFAGWSGSCSGTGSCVVTMSAARSVTATFSQGTPTSYLLSVSKTGSGTVTSAPVGINCGSDCSELYAPGTSVTLTATPATGSTFSGWNGNGISCLGTGTCAMAMSAARSVTATFTSTSSSANLCDGLVIDKSNHPMTALTKPALGQTVVDPQFGTTIRRITAVSGSGVIKPAYSTIPAWNADESYLILYHTGTSDSGHHLYNGKTYQHIKPLDISPADLEQFYWHTTDPDVLFYVNGNSLIRYHVSSGAKDVVKTFACGGSVSGGSDPMFMSWNSDVIALRCSSGYVFTYRISTNTVGTALSNGGDTAPQASASGALTFFSNGSAEVRDLNMNYLRGLPVSGEDHASLGRLASGMDTHNGVSFDGSYVGSLVTSDMTNGAARVIVGPATGYPYPPSGHHISAIAFKNPGWVGVSIVGNTNGQTALNNEILLANTNAGGQVCRVAHHRSYGKAGPRDYWAEPHVVISPRGTRLLFGSDWGGGQSVDSYVIELPSYQP
ncbi:MAG: InlB B-repeat-containing protein [Gammaproteobacteria bacterium]|nr:InlB B-repeat-containing protein [Gammaproteobacteria bacterium]